MTTDLLRDLGQSWGWIVLRGVAAVLFGVLAVAWPGVTLAALVMVWGAYAIADGVLALIAAWQVRDQSQPFWSLIFVGVIGIAAGIVTFAWPGITALALLTLIAAWALFVGILQIVAAIRLRKDIDNEWFLGLSGAVSVLFGVLVIARPGAGALAMLWTISAYAIVFGVLLILLGFRLHSYATGRAATA